MDINKDIEDTPQRRKVATPKLRRHGDISNLKLYDCPDELYLEVRDVPEFTISHVKDYRVYSIKLRIEGIEEPITAYFETDKGHKSFHSVHYNVDKYYRKLDDVGQHEKGFDVNADKVLLTENLKEVSSTYSLYIKRPNLKPSKEFKEGRGIKIASNIRSKKDAEQLSILMHHTLLASNLVNDLYVTEEEADLMVEVLDAYKKELV